MTTINQAFIKAYRHDAAQPAAFSPAIADTARPTASAVGTTIEYVSAEADSGSPPAALRAPRPLAASIDVLPYSASPSSDTLIPHPSREGPGDSQTDSQRWASSGRRVDSPGPEKRPLSAFLARPQTAPTAAVELEPADILRPGTTVAALGWPAVCRALAQHSGQELDRVADRLLAYAEQGGSLVGVLGLFPGRGCTTAALCLAARLATGDRRIILVDGNLCRPRLATWLDVVPTVGWQDVLEDAASLPDAVIRATDDQLDLLALVGESPADALRLASSPQARATAGVLRYAYDLVLVDLGAFFDPDSQPSVLELVRSLGIDAVLAVAGPTPADPRDLATVAEYLGQSGCELLGTIENRAAKPQAPGSAHSNL